MLEFFKKADATASLPYGPILFSETRTSWRYSEEAIMLAKATAP